MKQEKATTKTTLPSKALIQNGQKIKTFPNKQKAKIIQHHQTSLKKKENAKRASLGRKNKVDPQKQIQSNLEYGNRTINIYNYVEFKWNKCSNQKTQTGWMETTHPFQSYGHIQTESKGIEKDIPCQWKAKESWNSNTHIRQNRLENKDCDKR